MIPRRQDMIVTRWGARFLGRRFACAIGRGGISRDKREGDGATPAGVWCITGGKYRPDRGGKPYARAFQLTPISALDKWSDDPGDPDYNHAIRARTHPFSHENLRRADPLYDLILMSDWNWPDAEPKKGSAIFVHAWRKPRHPTQGCIAFSPSDLRWIAARWSPRARIIVRTGQP